MSLNPGKLRHRVTIQSYVRTTDAGGGQIGDVSHLYLPGTSGNYVSTPDSPPASVTGAIDIRAHVALGAYTGSLQWLVSKWNDPTNDKSYLFGITSAGTLRLILSPNGGASTTATSSAAVSTAGGDDVWLRATWRPSDGRVQFFTSSNGSTWAQLGTDQTIAMAAISDEPSSLLIGGVNGGAAGTRGRVYRAQVHDGIDGTLVADFDPDQGEHGADTLTATTGETWTIHGDDAELNVYREGWATQATVWAAVEPLAGTERLRAMQVSPTLSHRIRMRYRDGITSAHRLVYNGREFDITSVVDVGERHRELQLLAEER